MPTPPDRLARWVGAARAKLAAGTLRDADLDEVLAAQPRQRLRYLHALAPNPRSEVVSMALHEPDDVDGPQIGAEADWSYATVHAAIRDGWQVIHFPLQAAPFDDREIDAVGYEFILQKLES